MKIKDLCKEAHSISKEKGFYDLFDNGDIKPRNSSELLMLIVTELSEACEALREKNRQVYLKELGNKEILSKWEKDTFEDEIADTFIRLADLCGAMNIDIEWQIKKKLEFNRTRPYKHGKEF